MSEPTVEDQAALAVVFEENIRELVRKHLKAALEDYEFMNTVGMWAFAPRLIPSLPHDNLFQAAVRSVIVTQMQKY